MMYYIDSIKKYQTWILVAIIIFLLLLVIYFANRNKPITGIENISTFSHNPESTRSYEKLKYDVDSYEDQFDPDFSVEKRRSSYQPDPEDFPQKPEPNIPVETRKRPSQETKASDKNTKTKWKNEALCREALEKMFGVPFPSVQNLPWLRNPKTGRFLQLDCYNEDLKLALEYHGYQHYEFPNIYHKTREEFEASIYRDTIKRELCDKNGVYLITVPYTVKSKDFYKYIEHYLPHNRQYRLDQGLTN